MTISVGDVIRCDKKSSVYRLTVVSINDTSYIGTVQINGVMADPYNKETKMILNKTDAVIFGWYKESSSSFDIET